MISTNRLLLICLVCTVFLFTACDKTDFDEFTYQSNRKVNQELVQMPAPARYIVVLKEDNFTDLNSDSKLTLEGRKEIVREFSNNLLAEKAISNKDIPQVYGKVFQGFATAMTAEEAAALQNDNRVLMVEKDQIMSISPVKSETNVTPTKAQQTPYGITRVNGGIGGSTKTAWVIDTGVDLNHPDLNVDTERSKSFISLTPLGLFTLNSPDDQQGHGSHVAGTIAAIDNNEGVIGVAAGATVVAVRVLNAIGNGYNSDVIAGVDYVGANAVVGDVANMSLGGGVSAALDVAVQNASADGVYFVLAAGNDSEDANNSSPARVNGQYIVTVSASDINDDFASFSNFGNPPVDVCAPGVSVYSTSSSGGYATLSGTSMAAPHVAGILMLGAISTDGTVNNDPDGNADPIAVH